jgi:F420-non-reducing hydrogenase small subunit
MAKPKVAFYWCASCGGCEETVVDLAEDILGVVEKVEIVLWPVAMDFKYRDVEALPDQSIVATFLNGAIRSTEQAELARLLRRKSRYMIAYGSCAHTGGVPGLANLYRREELLQFNYEESPSVVNEGKVRPRVEHEEGGHRLHLPELHAGVRALDQVVEVDYYVPGCPPTPLVTKAAVGALLEGRLPERGSVLAPDVALCSECPRRESKPVDLAVRELVRPHQRVLDGTKCFLAQGVVCMGPATRAGCGGQCIGGNMPCTGCFGPTSRVRDQGAKMLSSLCSNLGPKDEAGVDAVLAGMPDPVGTLYRYGLAKSLLRRKVGV